MRGRVRRRAVLVGLGPLLGLACAVHAADPKPASPDSDFLEYLGSSDDIDAELQRDLAKTDEAASREAKPAPKRGGENT
jgi:hypothetical protein